MQRSVLAVGVILACAACASQDPAHDDVMLGPMPPASCDPGTRPSADKADCEPVGIASCADGFARADDGWGCEAVAPSGGCTNSKRARLGERSCLADVDCDAPFPPAGVDAVVASDSELTAALAKVRPGGTIALSDGVYGAISIDHDVNLVGRCPDRVRVRGTGERGIYVVGQVKASVRALAVEGFQGGIVAAYGPELDVANVVLSGNQLGVVAGESTVRVDKSIIEGATQGAADAQLGAKLTLTEVEIRDTSPAIAAYQDGTEVTLRRSIAFYTGSSRTSDMIHAWGGAKVTVDESLVSMRAGALMAVGNALPGTDVEAQKARGGVVRVVGSELRQTGFVRDAPWATAIQGGRIELESTSVLHESVFAFMVGDPETTFSAHGSAIRAGATDGYFRAALFVTDGASAEIDDTAVVGAIQSALTVGHAGSQLTLTGSLVTGTVFRGPGPNADEGGAGIAVAAGKEGVLVMHDSAVVGSEQFGLMADGDARAEIETSVFDGTRATDDAGGGEAVVVSGGAQLAMSSSLVRGSADAAVMAVGGEGIVDSSCFVANRVGIHVTGTKLVETDQKPDAIVPEELFLVGSVFSQTSESRVRESPIVLPGGPAVR